MAESGNVVTAIAPVLSALVAACAALGGSYLQASVASKERKRDREHERDREIASDRRQTARRVYGELDKLANVYVSRCIYSRMWLEGNFFGKLYYDNKKKDLDNANVDSTSFKFDMMCNYPELIPDFASLRAIFDKLDLFEDSLAIPNSEEKLSTMDQDKISELNEISNSIQNARISLLERIAISARLPLDKES